MGNGFSLLRLRDDTEVAPFVEFAEVHRVPLTVLELRGPGLEERYGAPLLLVRPDQHVGWRGTPVHRSEAEAIIDCMRGS